MNPILLDLGFIQIRWYSVLILIAFTIGYFLVINRCKKKGISLAHISDMCFYLVIICILGARLYYCLFNLDYYSKNILDIFKIWEGGLAIHGGVIAGIIFIYFYTRKKQIPLLDVFDIFAPALVLGQAIGRWGNFFNGEAFGPETTISTLKNLYIPQFIIDGMYINHNYYHPTFFYESLGCLIIFIIIMCIRNFKHIKPGQIASIYFIFYGLIRYFVEGLRQDSLMLFNLKVAKLVSIIMILVGIYLFIRPYIKRLKKKS
ncbi:MAG: prolipoprotein diacylglyceryl transferase [Firmicutes bacterium]|nr:prolipoprotein diacylglyceryl transferase [Bacillota bacterium]